MMDTNQPSLVPGWGPTSLLHHIFFRKISTSAASWFATVRGLVPPDTNGDGLPAALSPWDQLMASPARVSHFIAKKHPQQGEMPMSLLLEFSPRFKDRQGKWFHVYGHYTQVSIGLTDKQPPCFLSEVEATSSTFRYPPPTVPPARIPTIVVTDADGPMPHGADDGYSDEMYRAMTSGKGLLWSRWSGKFSQKPYGNGIERGDEIYFEDEEDGENEAQACLEGYPKVHEDTCPDAKEIIDVPTFNPEGSIIQKPKELEWWEIEEDDDDETKSADEESDSDLEYGYDDDSDEYGNDSEDQDFSGSEDGDDEQDDDSEDGDSGEDSDLGEETEDKGVFLFIKNNLSGYEAPVSVSSELKPNTTTTTHTYIGSHGRDTQNIQEGSDAEYSPPSCPSSDFESYKSCTTISSLPPTPITPSSPCLLPIDDISFIGGKVTRSEVNNMVGLWRFLGNPPRSLDLEFGGQVGHREVKKPLNIEALDLAG